MPMAHNEQENKKTKGGGRGDGAPGGNKVTQGRGSDTGNKGKR
jgi:hypothetical protein